MNYTIEQLRQAHLDAALAEWAKNVRDDEGGEAGDRDIIAGYFAATGWGSWLDAVTGGGYRENPRTSWCGQFVAAMGHRVGAHLVEGVCVPVGIDFDVARTVLVSTARLADRQRWKAAGVNTPTIYRKASSRGMLQRSDGRLVAPSTAIEPGVIATFRTSGRKPAIGDHIVLVERFDAEVGEVYTVEGNGRGTLGDGTWGEGVVRRKRPFSDIRRVYPLGLNHYEVIER